MRAMQKTLKALKNKALTAIRGTEPCCNLYICSHIGNNGNCSKV